MFIQLWECNGRRLVDDLALHGGANPFERGIRIVQRLVFRQDFLLNSQR